VLNHYEVNKSTTYLRESGLILPDFYKFINEKNFDNRFKAGDGVQKVKELLLKKDVF
jgi:hypothetical protein